MSKKLVLLSGFLLWTCISTLSAQKGWEVGPWAGVSYYFGDLNSNYDLSKPNFAGGFLARYNFNKRICLKFSAGLGEIQGDDADSDNVFERARNLNFRSILVDGTAQLEFNFLPYVHGSKEEFFTPYLFGGLSVFHFNPKTDYNGTTYELRGLGTEGQFKGEEYYTTQAALAFGIGMKVDLSYEWSLNFELSARRLYTDYLDDVSTVYPDKTDLLKLRGQTAVDLSDRSIAIPGVTDGPIGQAGRQRGDASNNDAYLFLSAAIVYYFGDLRCPPK
ncbi:MAG TPA: DUF6089 family protein [Flavilitoribacter sp.]|nr:DUF6089 family protein [Flavilitoribacter sp.]HMQ89877.1 DUF6089 family protein [Flavilitoribacter sp.]